ncbi:hypothetical protein CMK12_03170 [Candidatus Poribacteria bacterium]|jgi:hypothetical protein|nr:hypothetical protein [Candidatus Poribacteria bacterium]
MSSNNLQLSTRLIFSLKKSFGVILKTKKYLSQKSARETKGQPEVIRKKAFQLFQKPGTNKDIAEALSVSLVTVSNSASVKNGFKSQTRGPKSASKRFLSPEQEKTIPKLISDKDPEQLKLSFA